MKPAPPLLKRTVGSLLVEGLDRLLTPNDPLVSAVLDFMDHRKALAIPCKDCDVPAGEPCAKGRSGKQFFCWERWANAMKGDKTSRETA